MTDRYACAYLRRSVADEKANRGDVSREAQEAAILRAVQRDGWTGEVRTFEDWNRSADEAKEAKRTAYLAILSAIERNEIQTVYAAALDRLYRSSRTFWRLMDAAKAHGTRIVTDRDGVLGGDGSPMATAFATISAAFTTLELDTIKRRNQDATKARQARGDRMGVAPYGKRVVRDATGAALRPIRWEDDPARPLAPLLAAYRRAGTVLGASFLLDAEGVPTAHGNGGKWHPSALTLILAREGVLPPKGTRRPVYRTAILSGLLVCPCGQRLTPDHGKHGYYCRFGHWRKVDIHRAGLPAFVREDAILPAVRAEADRLRIPFDAVEIGQDDEGQRDSLAERRRRLALTFADGNLDEATYRLEIAKVAEQVERIEASREIVTVPPLDWTAPIAAVNSSLRALFAYVALDVDMHVAEIRWNVPEWRAE